MELKWSFQTNKTETFPVNEADKPKKKKMEKQSALSVIDRTKKYKSRKNKSQQNEGKCCELFLFGQLVLVPLTSDSYQDTETEKQR